MPSDFTAEIIIDFYIPEFMDASVPLQQISDGIANDSRRNIRQSIDFEDGSPFHPLAKKTIKDKRRLGVSNASLPLVRSGVMLNAIHSYKVRANLMVVGVISRGSPRRDLVALIQQEQGVNQFTRLARRFLGVSPKRREWAMARMKRWVAERIEKATKEYMKITI